MKVPLSWLKEHIQTSLSPEQIGEKLTLIGLEVEGIEATPLSFSGVVVGRIVETHPHPEAEKLCIAIVTDGSDTFQVVCGASNCRPGIKTPLAKIGARLEDEEGKAFVIKRTKLRGVESSGMLCGHDELKLPKGKEWDEKGIMELPIDLKEGTDLSDIYGDLVFEIALTPNLAHCASIRGIARELAAVTMEIVCSPKYELIQTSPLSIHDKTAVNIENPQACPRYSCSVITGVVVSQSPDWLKRRLEAAGIRSVNNIVDISNFVMLELGQPLHAFDFDVLEEKRIVVRNCKKNERIITLDQKEYYPSEQILVICDAKKPIAIAGVMGSKETEVHDKTQNVLLESAYFEPAYIRRAAKQLEIHSEASYRFERGTNPNGVIEALTRATALICEVAGGTALQHVIDKTHQTFSKNRVRCRLSRTNRILGTQLAMGEIETMFHRLGFEISSVQADLIEVFVPTYRHDVKEEIDLIEEISRIYGFHNIQKPEKPFFRTGNLPHSREFLFEKEVRRRCIAEGLQELMTCDLISSEQADLIDPDSIPSRNLIKLLNPSSVDQSVLRPSLLPGLLSVLKHNTDRGVHSLAGFEIGRVHFTTKERFFEPTVVSFLLTGERRQQHWEFHDDFIDYFDLKGIVENIIESLHISMPSFHPSDYSNFHPGRQAVIKIGEMETGIIGEIHPTTLKKAGLEFPVYFAEMNLEDLIRLLPATLKLEPIPQYPASSRDWTVTVKEEESVGEILNRIQNTPSPLLESISLRGIYRSEKLGSGKKNVTIRFVYRDPHKTVSVQDVEKEHLRIIKINSVYLSQNGEKP